MSGLTISDQLDLIFRLYAAYKEHIKSYPKEFEDFYPWGKMIISDFDEIDKYLIDSEELFRTLKEFKAIEDITRAEKSDIYNRYTGFWGDMGVLYREFNSLKDIQYPSGSEKPLPSSLPTWRPATWPVQTRRPCASTWTVHSRHGIFFPGRSR